MQLSYRGLTYNKLAQSTQVTAKKIVGKYRGVSLNSRPSELAIAPQTTRNLKYRGLAYEICH